MRPQPARPTNQRTEAVTKMMMNSEAASPLCAPGQKLLVGAPILQGTLTPSKSGEKPTLLPMSVKSSHERSIVSGLSAPYCLQENLKTEQKRMNVSEFLNATGRSENCTDFSSASNMLNVRKQNPSCNQNHSSQTAAKSDISFASKTNSLLQLSRSLPA